MAFLELDTNSRCRYLEKVFKYLNKAFFNGELSAVIDIGSCGADSPAVQFDLDVIPDANLLFFNLDSLLPLLPATDWTWQSRVISKLLAHEMLHQYCYQKHGNIDTNHGELFSQAMSLLGFTGSEENIELPGRIAVGIAKIRMIKYYL